MPEQVYITQPEDDEIIISLVEHQNVVHDTVRIGVQVQVEHDPNEQSEDQLRTNIRLALKHFLNVDDWRFTRVQRERGQTRFEQVIVAAIARVSESENRMLFERANAASKQGLQLVNPVATYALPFDKVQQINRDLRIALFKQAQEECNQYNAVKEGNHYRVALVEFADTPRMGDANQNRAARAYAANTTSAYAPSGAAGDEPDEGSQDLGVTERFWVAAQVTLRANRQ